MPGGAIFKISIIYDEPFWRGDGLSRQSAAPGSAAALTIDACTDTGVPGIMLPQHQLINQIAEQSDSTELGGKLTNALADRLHITRAEANRRVAEAADLGPRRALTGEPLRPLLTATAAAQRAGRIGSAHVRVIRDFLNRLPSAVDIETREKAEAHLAKLATQFRPDQVAKLADRLTDCLNPDGNYTDEDRARRRGLTLGKQHIDGMSPLRGWLTPEARATLEAVLAKLAAPGMANPDDQTPMVDSEPAEEVVQRDTRSPSQRNHDGLNAALRIMAQLGGASPNSVTANRRACRRGCSTILAGPRRAGGNDRQRHPSQHLQRGRAATSWSRC